MSDVWTRADIEEYIGLAASCAEDDYWRDGLCAINARIEQTERAVSLAQDYINNVLGVPSPDFVATVALEGAS